MAENTERKVQREITLATVVLEIKQLQEGQKELKTELRQACETIFKKINGTIQQTVQNTQDIAVNKTRLTIVLGILIPILAGLAAALMKAFA